jgi:hypothetical protein
MLTIFFYTAARILVMLFGWLVALMLALGANYMLPGVLWPLFIVFGAWWTLTFVLFVRSEVERSRGDPTRQPWWRYSTRS